MTSRAQAPGSLPRPGPIGRTARFALGIVTAAVLVAVALPRLERPPGSESPSLLFLAAVLLTFRLVGDIVELVFRRPWGRSARIAGVAGIGPFVAVDLVAYGRWWAPPLAWYLFLLVELSLGVLAISFITASILAVPG